MNVVGRDGSATALSGSGKIQRPRDREAGGITTLQMARTICQPHVIHSVAGIWLSACDLNHERGRDLWISPEGSLAEARGGGESGCHCLSGKGGAENTDEEVAAFGGEHRSETDAALAFEADDSAVTVPAGGVAREILASGAEIGERVVTGPANGADAGKYGELVEVAGNDNLARNGHHAPGDKKAGADEERDSEERRAEGEVAFGDLGSIDAAERPARPHAGEGDDENCKPVSGCGASAEAVGQGFEPGAGGRRAGIDRG